MLQIVLEGLLLGLSTGAYCVGVCLVFFLPYLLVEARKNIFENIRNILFFMLGRLIAYIIFASLMGILSIRYKQNIAAKFSYASLIIISLLMVIYAITHNFRESRFCKIIFHHFSLRRMPFALGILSGLNPCLPFLLGTARIWTLESIWLGVVLFFAFFMGTSVYMIPLVFVSYLNRIERLQQIGLIMAFLSGLWFLFVGISGLIAAR